MSPEHSKRRKWQPTSVFLPEKSHGQRSLVGYIQSMGSHGVRRDRAKHADPFSFSSPSKIQLKLWITSKKGLGEEIKGTLLNVRLNTSHKVDPFIHIPVSLNTHLITAASGSQSTLSPKFPEKYILLEWLGFEGAGCTEPSESKPLRHSVPSQTSKGKPTGKATWPPAPTGGWRQPSHTLASGVWGQMSGP